MESKNNVKEYFEQVDKYLFRDFGVRLRQELIFAETGNMAGKKILDIGCGNGSISMPYIKENHITFLDFSDGMLALVRSNIPEKYILNADVRNQDFTKLGSEEKFDLVLFIGVMAHSPISLKENLIILKSLLNQGGQLFFQFSDAEHWITKFEYKLRKGTYDVKKISKSDFKLATKEAGLVIKKELAYASILPGMGRLSNGVLYKYANFFTRHSLFNLMRSEYIYQLIN
jgi:2-polyprenyl-3-methyl-5-hydroxy-6-metoxy-1,4-benzoquinol methylase